MGVLRETVLTVPEQKHLASRISLFFDGIDVLDGIDRGKQRNSPCSINDLAFFQKYQQSLVF